MLALRQRFVERPWDVILPICFAIYSSWMVITCLYEPGLIGSHAVIYSEAAAAWFSGGDPWTVGPEAAVFAGPPSMLVPFVPFSPLAAQDHLVIRFVWVAGMTIAAVWTVRRLRIPGYWIGFPPVFEAILLGHPEVLVLALLVLGGPVSGIAATIKPYAVLPLIAERRWPAISLAATLIVLSLLVLPWAMFFDRFADISRTLATQSRGDSVFGSPILMVIAIVALAVLGRRRALWLAVPVLWPSAQFLYKTGSVPALSPIVAACWAFPIPGMTLLGVTLEAVVRLVGRSRPLPDWLRSGIEPIAIRTEAPSGQIPSLTPQPRAA